MTATICGSSLGSYQWRRGTHPEFGRHAGQGQGQTIRQARGVLVDRRLGCIMYHVSCTVCCLMPDGYYVLAVLGFTSALEDTSMVWSGLVWPG